MTEAKEGARLCWLVVRGRVGFPVELAEVAVSDLFELEHSAYKGAVKKGKRWQDVLLSVSRLGKPEVSLMNGRIEGSIWCFLEDKDQAQESLVQAARTALEAEVERLQASIDSLGTARTPSIR